MIKEKIEKAIKDYDSNIDIEKNDFLIESLIDMGKRRDFLNFDNINIKIYIQYCKVNKKDLTIIELIEEERDRSVSAALYS